MRIREQEKEEKGRELEIRELLVIGKLVIVMMDCLMGNEKKKICQVH
jgi:hypothetical protein